MNVKILSCWFTTSYGTYTSGLRRALERRLGVSVGIVPSNCGCHDPMEVQRKFVDSRCEVVELPNVSYYTLSSPTKQRVLDGVRQAVYYARARRYLKLSGDADVMHFQQILNAFGSLALFHRLAMPSRAARVVTVHELDPYQQAHPRASLGYTKADAVLVHTEKMRGDLVALGVEPDRIEVVHHGIDPDPTPDGPRSGLAFWGVVKRDSSPSSRSPCDNTSPELAPPLRKPMSALRTWCCKPRRSGDSRCYTRPLMNNTASTRRITPAGDQPA